MISLCKYNNNYKITKKNLFKQKVTFNYLVDVIFIPSLNDYRKMDLIHEIWWNDIDYYVFKNSAKEEVFEFMKINKCVYVNEALRVLYQPQ